MPQNEIGLSSEEKILQRLTAIEHRLSKLQKVETPRKSTIQTGWIHLGQTLTYASASTVTFSTIEKPTETSTEYVCNLQSGMRLCFDQAGTTKFFNITDVTSPLVATTTLTLDGGAIYTVANTNITNPKYALGSRPFGFPESMV